MLSQLYVWISLQAFLFLLWPLFPSFDRRYTNRQELKILLNTSGTLYNWCVHSPFLPFRISTVVIKGVCRPASQNKDFSQQQSRALTSLQSPSTLRWERVTCDEFSVHYFYHSSIPLREFEFCAKNISLDLPGWRWVPRSRAWRGDSAQQQIRISSSSDTHAT